MATASLTNYRQSPRKVRLVANLVKGKFVSAAIAQLSFLPKRAALPMRKLIESAVANAKQNDGISGEDLFIKEVRVDKGITMKRSMPRARGSAYPIHKHSSHVIVVLERKEPLVKKIKHKK